MTKSNQNILSQFINITYFTASLVMCTICADRSVIPFLMQENKPVEASCTKVSADLLTEESNALYTHFIQ